MIIDLTELEIADLRWCCGKAYEAFANPEHKAIAHRLYCLLDGLSPTLYGMPEDAWPGPPEPMAEWREDEDLNNKPRDVPPYVRLG